MKIFSKLKDHNLKLEEILDRKYFSSNIKNLLLSMIYKIENAYKDYETIKRVVRSREDFLIEVVETISKNCENVKLVEPDSKNSELLKKHKVLALTNEKERSILAYPTEISLLYGISDIKPKYFYINNNVMFKKLLQDMLVEGYNTNNLEILINFNGWSWDTKSKADSKYINNLIYQDFLFLCGETFLKEWRNTSFGKIDYYEELQDRINVLDKNNKFIINMYKVLYSRANKKEKDNINIKLREKNKELTKISNKEKFIEDMKKQRIILSKKLEKYDLMLNEEKLLEKEFKKRNLKLEEDKRIGNIKIFQNMIIREKAFLLEEYKKVANLCLPVNYLKYKEELENYKEIYTNKNSIDKDIIELQIEFLKIMEQKIIRATTNEELVNNIYILRYFKNININKEYQIKDIEVLNNYTNKIMKLAITRTCKSGIIKIISMDIETNYEIIKYAIDSKIIDLQEIKIFLELEKDNLIIKIYDKEIFETQKEIQFTGNKQDFEVKFKKFIKLFN